MKRTRKPNNYWTRERCYEDALLSSTKKEWFTRNVTAYNTAHRKGFSECFTHFKQNKRIVDHPVSPESAVCLNYRPLLEKIASYIVSSQDVDDVVQDTLIQAMLRFDTYDPSKGDLSTWLGMISRNIAIKRYHQLSKIAEECVDDVDVIDEYEEYIDVDERHAQVLELIRDDVVLRRWNITEEFIKFYTDRTETFEQIAKEVGMNRATLVTYFQEAKRRIAENWNKKYGK